jgi:hypothetical protein
MYRFAIDLFLYLKDKKKKAPSKGGSQIFLEGSG